MKKKYITLILCLIVIFAVASVSHLDAEEQLSPVLTFTEKNYQTEVLDAKGVVLVEFWASWCAPCRKMAPILKQYAENNEGKVKVGKVNAESYKVFVIKLGVEVLPTLIVYKDGIEKGRYMGMLTAADLDKFVLSKISN